MPRLVLEDSEVFNIWKSPDEYYDQEEIDEIHPDWYQENGIPMCNHSDEKMIYSHTEVELPTPTVVMLIEEGNVDKVWVFYRRDKAEEKFTELVKDYFKEYNKINIENAIIDGRYSVNHMDRAICIKQPK